MNDEIATNLAGERLAVPDGDAPSGTTKVEVMGFEPTASSMRPKRSSQLSYTPGWDGSS